MNSENYGDRFGITATCYELYETFQIEIQDLKKHISSGEIAKILTVNDEQGVIGETCSNNEQKNSQNDSDTGGIMSTNNSKLGQICKTLLNKIECISEIVEGMFAKVTSVMNGAEKSKDGSQLQGLEDELQLSKQIIHQQNEQLDRLNQKRIKWQDKKHQLKNSIQELNEQVSDQRLAVRNLQEETANLVREESEKAKKMDKWFVRLLEKIELDLVEQQSNKLQAVVEKVRNARKNKPWKSQLVYQQAQSIQQGRRNEGISSTPLNMYSDINQEDFSPASSEGQDNMAASADCSINKAIVFSDGQCSCVFNTDRRKYSEEDAEEHKNNPNNNNNKNANPNNLCYANNMNQHLFQKSQDDQHHNRLRIKYQQQQQVRLNLAELTQEKVSHFIRSNNLDMSVSQLEQEVLNYFQKTDRSTTNTQLNLKDVQLEDILNVTQQNNSASLELDFQKEANRTIDKLLSGLQNTLSKKQPKNEQNNNNNNEDFLQRNTGNNEDFPQELSPISSEKTLTLHLSGVALPGALRSQVALSSSLKQSRNIIQQMPQYVLTKKYTHNAMTTNTDLFILKEIADSENKEDGVNDSNQVFQAAMIKNVKEFKEDIDPQRCQIEDIKEKNEMIIENKTQQENQQNEQMFQDKSFIPSMNKLPAEGNSILSLQTMLENIKIEDQQENVTSSSCCQDASCFDKLNEALVQYTEEKTQCSILNSKVFPSTERTERAQQQLLFSQNGEEHKCAIGNSDKSDKSKNQGNMIQIESQLPQSKDKNSDRCYEKVSNDLDAGRLHGLEEFQQKVKNQNIKQNQHFVEKNEKNSLQDKIFEDNFKEINDFDDINALGVGGLHDLSNQIQDFSQISIVPSENSNSCKKYPAIPHDNLRVLNIQDFSTPEIPIPHGAATPIQHNNSSSYQHQIAVNQCLFQKIISDKPPIIPIINPQRQQQQQQPIQHSENQIKKGTQMQSFQVSLDQITIAQTTNTPPSVSVSSEHHHPINQIQQLELINHNDRDSTKKQDIPNNTAASVEYHKKQFSQIDNAIPRNIIQQHNNKLLIQQPEVMMISHQKDTIHTQKSLNHGQQQLILEDSSTQHNPTVSGINSTSTKANNNNNNGYISNAKEGFQSIKQVKLISSDKVKKDITHALLSRNSSSSNAIPNVSINTHHPDISNNSLKNNNVILGNSSFVPSPCMKSTNQRSINAMQESLLINNHNQNNTAASIDSHVAVENNSSNNNAKVDSRNGLVTQPKASSSLLASNSMNTCPTNGEENSHNSNSNGNGGEVVPRHKKKKALLIVNKSYDFGNSIIQQQQAGQQGQLELMHSPVSTVGQIYTGPTSASSALTAKNRLIQEGMARQIRSLSKRTPTAGGAASGCPLRSSTPINPKDRVIDLKQEQSRQDPGESVIKSQIMRSITQQNCQQDQQIYHGNTNNTNNIKREETFKTAPDCCLGFYTIPTLELEEDDDIGDEDDEDDEEEESQITLKSIGLQKKKTMNKQRAISIDDESKRYKKVTNNQKQYSPMMNDATNQNNITNKKTGMSQQAYNQSYANSFVHSGFSRGIKIEDKENASRQVLSSEQTHIQPSSVLKTNINVNNSNNSKQYTHHLNISTDNNNSQKQQLQYQQQSKQNKSSKQCLTPTTSTAMNTAATMPQKILLKKQKKITIPVNTNQSQQSLISNVSVISTNAQIKYVSRNNNNNSSNRISQLVTSQNHSIDSLNPSSKTPNNVSILREWERSACNNNSNSSSLPRYSSSLRSSSGQ